MIYKMLHTNLKIRQYETHYKPVVDAGVLEG